MKTTAVPFGPLEAMGMRFSRVFFMMMFSFVPIDVTVAYTWEHLLEKIMSSSLKKTYSAELALSE